MIEHRLMRAVTYSEGNTNSELSGTYFGMVLFGDNGDVNGMPTTAAGQSDTAEAWGYSLWDENLDNGLDTDAVGAIFSINTDSSHTANWNVDYDNETFAVNPLMEVHSVTIHAAVSTAGMAFDWTKIQVDFYHGGEIVETDHINDLHANTLGSTSADPAESTAVVTPTAANVDGVRVQGVFRMRTDEGTYPGWTDIVGQVAVS